VSSESAKEDLFKDLAECQAKLSKAEQSSSTALINLNMLQAQHKREVSQLQREVESWKTAPDVEASLAQLEERNKEMEELLKQKCAEIEENDDRAIAYVFEFMLGLPPNKRVQDVER
jgi:hypothetical protein